MVRSAKRSLTFIMIFLLVSAAVLCFASRPARADDTDVETVYLQTQQLVQSMMDTPEKAVYGNEWLALDLARDEEAVSPYYLKSLVDTIIENDGVLHTNNYNYSNYAKVVLVLSSLGIDATNVAGYNLIERVSYFPMVATQGVNGIIYALLALDSNDYEIQVKSPIPLGITRDTYIYSIINSQLDDGGFVRHRAGAGGACLPGEEPHGSHDRLFRRAGLRQKTEDPG